MYSQTSPASTPPDGGWGWWVVVGSFVINLLTAGSSWAFGVLYVALLDALGGTKAQTALVGSLVYMILVFMAPYASALCRLGLYGHRRVIMIGGAVASASIFGSSFTTQITQMYYTYGMLTGFGYGCCLLPSYLIVKDYFKTRMGVAMGISMSGGGLGICIMASLTQHLLDLYGWRGCLQILGAINAYLCVAGALMRPVSHIVIKTVTGQKQNGYSNIQTPNSKENKLQIEINNDGKVQACPDEGDALCNTPSDDDIKTLQIQTQILKDQNTGFLRQCCSCPQRVFAFLDAIYKFSLFKDPVYDLYQASIIVRFIGMSIFTTHVVRRALDFGISYSSASSLVYGFGIGQAIGRALGGVCVDHIPMNRIIMCALTLFISAVATIASTYFTSYIGQQVSSLVIGSNFGAVAVISVGVLVDVFGHNNLSYTLSVCYVFGGIGTVIGPALAGYVRDKYGIYDSAFQLAGVADATCGLIMLAMIPLIRFNRGRYTHEIIDKEDAQSAVVELSTSASTQHPNKV